MIVELSLAAAGGVATFAAGYAFARHASQGSIDALRAEQTALISKQARGLEASQQLQEAAEAKALDAATSRRQVERALGIHKAPLSAPQALQSLVGSTSGRGAVLADADGLEWAGVGKAEHRERLACLGVVAPTLDQDDILVVRSRRGEAVVLAAVGERALAFHRGIGEHGLFAFERSLVELRRGQTSLSRRGSPLPVRSHSGRFDALEARLKDSGARSLLALGLEQHEGNAAGGNTPTASDVATLAHLFGVGPALGLGRIGSIEWRRPSGTLLVVPAANLLFACSFEDQALDDARAERIESLIATQALQEAA